MGAMVCNFGKYIAVLEVITMKFHTIKNIKNQPNEIQSFLLDKAIAIETAVMNRNELQHLQNVGSAATRWKKSGCFLLTKLFGYNWRNYWSQISNHLFICSHRCEQLTYQYKVDLNFQKSLIQF
jgi:hypothetical protein